MAIELRSSQSSFKSNARRLLLIVTRGVYYLKTKQQIYWFTKTRDRYEQKCNAKYFSKKIKFCASIARGLLDATRAVGNSRWQCRALIKTFLKSNWRDAVSFLNAAGNAGQKQVLENQTDATPSAFKNAAGNAGQKQTS